MKRVPQQNGFTLLEILIAITILAMMSLAMFGASTQIIQSKNLVETRDEVRHSVNFAFAKMAEDLDMAYIIKNRDLLGTQFDGEVAFQGGEERVDFVSFSHFRYLKGVPESESCEVSYYLVRDPEGRDTNILMRRESTLIDKDLQDGGQAYPLLQGVRRLSFEYLPLKSDEWKRVWDSKSISSGNTLPRAVKIQMEVQLPEEEEVMTFSTISPIRLREPILF